ncbi:MAG: hypothetical protein FJX19_00005, partial [Alphaproteobacteria bacterium]|nr:hypothetical protein [Alphaproteobacteria bacterium]
LAENIPETLARTRKFGMLSDWIATRLTGEFLTEPSSGSSTALFDLRTRRWSPSSRPIFSAPSSPASSQSA